MRNESKPVGAEHFQNRVVGPTCILYCALARQITVSDTLK